MFHKGGTWPLEGVANKCHRVAEENLSDFKMHSLHICIVAVDADDDLYR